LGLEGLERLEGFYQLLEIGLLLFFMKTNPIGKVLKTFQTFQCSIKINKIDFLKMKNKNDLK